MARGLLGLQEMFETSLMDTLPEELPDEAPRDLEERLTSMVSDLADSLTESLGPMVQKAALRGLKAKRKYQQKFERGLNRHWQKPLELLDLFILVATEAGDDFHREFVDEAQRSNDFKFAALVSLHARACRMASAILALLRSGFADDADALWRGLHEISVVSSFVSKHCQDTAKSYLLHETIQQYRLALNHREHAAKLREEPISQEEFDQLKARHDDLLEEFGPSFGKTYGWAALALKKKDPRFTDIEEAVDLEHWRPYYNMASANLHANAHGNFFNLGSSQLTHGVLLAGPSNMGLVDPGQQTAISLCQVTTVLLTTEPYLDGLVISKLLGSLMEEIGEAFLQDHKEMQLLADADGENFHAGNAPPSLPVLAGVAPTMRGRFRSLVRAYLKPPY